MNGQLTTDRLLVDRFMDVSGPRTGLSVRLAVILLSGLDEIENAEDRDEYFRRRVNQLLTEEGV